LLECRAIGHRRLEKFDSFVKLQGVCGIEKALVVLGKEINGARGGLGMG
jgi:hypothetical protein